jgi:hypothetical protein
MNPAKRRKTSMSTEERDDDDDNDDDDGKRNASRSTVTFTKCCSSEVHTACLKEDGCPRCDDFDND